MCLRNKNRDGSADIPRLLAKASKTGTITNSVFWNPTLFSREAIVWLIEPVYD